MFVCVPRPRLFREASHSCTFLRALYMNVVRFSRMGTLILAHQQPIYGKEVKEAKDVAGEESRYEALEVIAR